MHWVRKPRLNSAVATVAVLMVFSLLRVASLSLVMISIPVLSFRDGPKDQTRNLEVPRCAIAHLRFASRPGTTTSVNRRLADRRAKAGFEKIEIAALIGLPDVTREHPAIAALKTGLGRLPFGAAFCQSRFGYIEIDAARRDVERDAVAVAHQRQRPADIGFRRHMQ